MGESLSENRRRSAKIDGTERARQRTASAPDRNGQTLTEGAHRVTAIRKSTKRPNPVRITTGKYRGLQRMSDVSGGLVCFAGTGIIVSAVAERFFAGDSIAEIAADYDWSIAKFPSCLSHGQIEAGIRLYHKAARRKISIERFFDQVANAEATK